MRTIRVTLSAALAAALLAGVAQAQGRSPSDVVRGTPPATPPAGSPQATPAPAPAPGAPGQSQALPGDALEKLNAFHAQNIRATEYGKLLAEKGTNDRAKDFGRRVSSEHERLDRELAGLASARGIQLADVSHLRNDPELQRYRAMPAPEMESTLMDAFAKERVKMVDDLKALRKAVPGKDAELKKWVDTAENVMEEQRNLAREVRKDTQQRQGRKP